MTNNLILEDKMIAAASVLAGAAMSLALVGWGSKKLKTKALLKVK